MSFTKIRLPLGIIGTLMGIVLIISMLTDMVVWKELRWISDSTTWSIVLLVGCFMLVFGLHFIVQDMDKLNKYMFGRSDSNSNG